MGKEGYQNLVVWRRSKDLAVRIYKLTGRGALARDFWLRDQIRRSAVSIASNLAEGAERGTDKDGVRFFHMARGSLGELRTQMQIASEVGLLNQAYFEDLETECASLGKMIGGLIKARA